MATLTGVIWNACVSIIVPSLCFLCTLGSSCILLLVALNTKVLSLSVRNENSGVLSQTAKLHKFMHEAWNAVFVKLQASILFFKFKNTVDEIHVIETERYIRSNFIFIDCRMFRLNKNGINR